MAGQREHGYARYRLDGCRCYVCGFARSRYDENRSKAIVAGTWQPYVDASPVREHLRVLQSCGMGLRAIAAVADVDRKRLQSVLTGRPERGAGPQEKVRPELAAAVLGVEPTLGNLAPNTLVNPVGTRRRIQALVARGWPQHHLAVALGMTPNNFGALLARPHVLARRALAVQALYDERWKQDPRAHGVDNQAYSRALNHASRAEWAPVGAWDDDTIDDPAATPWAVPEGQARLSRDELAAVRREEIAHLIQFNVPESDMARRLKMSESSVRNIVAELRGETPAAIRRTEPGRRLKPCGTRAAYTRHRAHGEEPCAACKAANNRQDRRYRLMGSTNAA